MIQTFKKNSDLRQTRFCVKTVGKKKSFLNLSNLILCQNCWQKIVLFKLLVHLEHNNLRKFFSQQTNHSTVQRQPCFMSNYLLTSSDSDQTSVFTLLDLSVAFDKIDHDLLLNRLRDVFGIRE